MQHISMGSTAEFRKECHFEQGSYGFAGDHSLEKEGQLQNIMTAKTGQVLVMQMLLLPYWKQLHDRSRPKRAGCRHLLP